MSEVCVVVVTLIYWLDVPVSCSSIIVVLPLSPYWPAIVVVSELDVIAFSLLLDPVLDIADVEYEVCFLFHYCMKLNILYRYYRPRLHLTMTPGVKFFYFQ